ncbi:hypothetical protein [Bradyrhizobium sp.]|uniref:hypothetical protein n=1 Tax=Bradyrhizobium sp. TaxID=376 RepID=UPI003C69C1D6
MSQLTIFLARLLGLFTILIIAVLFVRGNALVEAAVTNQPAMLIYGVTSLVGLAMVLSHNVWAGGVLPVVVTLVGWLKGLFLLVVSPETLTQIYGQTGYGAYFDLYLVPSLVIGLYLTIAGFIVRASR